MTSQTSYDPAVLARHLEFLEATKAFKDTNKIRFFKPYPKQLSFFALGAAIRERREGARAEAGEDIIGMVAVGKPVQ